MQMEREFPVIPEWLRTRQGVGAPARLRRFGSNRSDLEIDFAHGSLPAMVARVLSLCSRSGDGRLVGEDTVFDLPVGLQLEAMLALAELSETLPFTWRFRCAAAQCGSESEFELTVNELSALADHSRKSETTEVGIDGYRLTLRRPTGRDQLKWLEESTEPGPGAMLRQILVSPSWDELERQGLRIEAIETAVDEAMREFDPLPGFEMQVVCPECAMSSTVAPALTVAALQRLVGAQEGLLDDVHRIALHYHWTETQILSMPAWRRQEYLARIEWMESSS